MEDQYEYNLKNFRILVSSTPPRIPLYSILSIAPLRTLIARAYVRQYSIHTRCLRWGFTSILCILCVHWEEDPFAAQAVPFSSPWLQHSKVKANPALVPHQSLRFHWINLSTKTDREKGTVKGWVAGKLDECYQTIWQSTSFKSLSHWHTEKSYPGFRSFSITLQSKNTKRLLLTEPRETNPRNCTSPT